MVETLKQTEATEQQGRVSPAEEDNQAAMRMGDPEPVWIVSRLSPLMSHLAVIPFKSRDLANDSLPRTKADVMACTELPRTRLTLRTASHRDLCHSHRRVSRRRSPRSGRRRMPMPRTRRTRTGPSGNGLRTSGRRYATNLAKAACELRPLITAEGVF